MSVEVIAIINDLHLGVHGKVGDSINGECGGIITDTRTLCGVKAKVKPEPDVCNRCNLREICSESKAD